jgi:hypothetical protein
MILIPKNGAAKVIIIFLFFQIFRIYGCVPNYYTCTDAKSGVCKPLPAYGDAMLLLHDEYYGDSVRRYIVYVALKNRSAIKIQSCGRTNIVKNFSYLKTSY